jgi:hypothetical protein
MSGPSTGIPLILHSNFRFQLTIRSSHSTVTLVSCIFCRWLLPPYVFLYLFLYHRYPVATHVVGLGVVYQRRLETIGKKCTFHLTSSPYTSAKVTITAPVHSSDPIPTITASMSQQWLDQDTQRAWSNNDMATIEQFKARASTDLDPIYQNIKTKGNDAWIEVESEGQKYHVSYTQNATIWAYTQDQPSANANSNTKDTIISIGSYSIGANFLGISTYTWTNLPVRNSIFPLQNLPRLTLAQ